MSIAYDYVSGTGGSGSSVSCGHTVSGSQPCLLAFVVGDDSDELASVSFGGVPLSLIDKQQEPGTNRWQYYYLTNSPSLGGNTLAATFSAPQDFNAIFGISYNGVDASQPHAYVKNTHNATSGTEPLTTDVDNCWVVQFMWAPSAEIVALTVDGNAATARVANWIYDFGPLTPAQTFDVYTEFAGSTSFATIAIALSPYTGSTGDGSYTEDFAGSAADLTTPWRQWRTAQPMRRNGSGAATPTNTSQESGAIYNDATSANQYSQIAVGFAPSATKYVILMVRNSSEADSYTTGSGYFFSSNGVDFSGIFVYTAGKAGYTPVITHNAFVFSSGDVLKLQVVGTTLRLYVNGTINTNFTATNAALSSGFPGFGLYGSTAVTADNWAGGDDTFSTAFSAAWAQGANQ